MEKSAYKYEHKNLEYVADIHGYYVYLSWCISCTSTKIITSIRAKNPPYVQTLRTPTSEIKESSHDHVYDSRLQLQTIDSKLVWINKKFFITNQEL